MFYHAPEKITSGGFRALPSPAARPPAAEAGAGPAPSQEMNIFGLLAIIRRRWPVGALIVFIAVSLAAAWAFSVTPLYTSTAEVLITPRQKALVGGGLLSPGLSSELMMIESQARIIASESVLRRVVRGERLDTDAEFNGTRPDASLRGRLRALLGRKEKAAGRMSPQEAALRTLGRRLSVRRAEKTFVLEISVTSEDPRKAARLANAVARAYIADQSDTKSSTARQVNAMLTKRLETLRRQVTEAEAKVEDFKRRHNIVATRKDQLENEARLARLGEELVKARSRAAAARAKYDSVKAVLTAGAPPEATWEAVNSPVISRLRADYARAAGQAASLAETLGPRHPKLLAARAQAQRIRRLIRDELSRLARSVKAERDAAVAELKTIERNLERVKNSAAMTNEARVRLRELEREARARRKVFETFLLKSKESNEAEKLQIPDARLISPAIPPLSASFPRKKMILGLAGLLGLGLGLAAMILSEARANARRAPLSPAGAAAPFQPPALPAPPPGLPPLATLPALRLRAEETEEDVFCEIFETLASPAGAGRAAFAGAAFGILDALEEGRRALAVTAPSPEHGSTTLAWTLTAAAALRGRRTLLVDANRVNPRLTRVLLPGSHPSLRDALTGRARPEDLLLRDPDTGIDFLSLALPEGFRPARGAARALRDWLAGLITQYDLVIFDAPPLSRAENIFDLVSLLDGVLLCVAQKASGDAAARAAANLLRNAGLTGGVIWNLGATSGAATAGGGGRRAEADADATR